MHINKYTHHVRTHPCTCIENTKNIYLRSTQRRLRSHKDNHGRPAHGMCMCVSLIHTHSIHTSAYANTGHVHPT